MLHGRPALKARRPGTLFPRVAASEQSQRGSTQPTPRAASKDRRAARAETPRLVPTAGWFVRPDRDRRQARSSAPLAEFPQKHVPGCVKRLEGVAVFRKAKSIVGLDLGSYVVKAVEISLEGLEPVLTGFAVVEVPPGGERSTAIAQAFEQGNFKTRNVVTSVSGQSVVVRYISMVQMSDSEPTASDQVRVGQVPAVRCGRGRDRLSAPQPAAAGW